FGVEDWLKAPLFSLCRLRSAWKTNLRSSGGFHASFNCCPSLICSYMESFFTQPPNIARNPPKPDIPLNVE
ncbi:hypothetical protein KI387_027773, partial [Taxus chinensis]